MSNKNVLRKQIKETLSALSKPLYEDYSYKIANKLYKDENWIEAKVIGITISKAPEVDTYQIVRKAWELGKKVAIPKCNPDEKSLSFRAIHEFSELESVYYGLLEPIVERTSEVIADEIDLLIVPGAAYTREGYRLGFGGGYYDRYLTRYFGQTLSLAFTEQIITHIPIEHHDIPVAKIITNLEIITPK